MKKNENHFEVTLLIAAAGKGSRMGYPELPKALVAFQGKTLVEWATINMRKVIQKGILVTRPEQENKFRKILNDWNWDDFSFAIQETPLGTAFAVQQGLNKVQTNWVLCVWGDHIGARYLKIEKLLSEIDNPDVDFILPTVERDEPYVYFHLNDHSNYLKFEETKNGSTVQSRGQSDCGLFLFRRKIVKDYLDRKLEKYDSSFKGEINFLSLFHDMNNAGILFKLIEFCDERLTIGINSKEDIFTYEETLEMDDIHE